MGSPRPAPFIRDYAGIWQAADKVVYSRTLPSVSTEKTKLVWEFDPEEVSRMKALARSDLSVGGPDLAGQAIRWGLVDEIHLFLNPVVVGGGNRALPDDVRVDLDLMDERRFGSGVLHVHYRITS